MKGIMTRRGPLMLLALLCAALVWAGALAEEETVSYQVLALDGALNPVEGMRLTVTDWWEDEVCVLYTDAEGRAAAELPAEEAYTLQAWPPVGTGVRGGETVPLDPEGQSLVMIIDAAELIVPLTGADVPEPPEDCLWLEESDDGCDLTWQDEAHGPLVMTVRRWSDGRLLNFTERLGQVAYTFDFNDDSGEELMTGYTVEQLTGEDPASARYDRWGNVLHAEAGDYAWSAFAGWCLTYGEDEGPAAMPEGVIDVVALGPLTAQPAPAKPDANALPVRPGDLPRVESVALEQGQITVTLDKGLYDMYGCFAPVATGCALSLRVTLEDGSTAVISDGDEITAASEARDAWVCAAPEGAVSAAAFLTYESLDTWTYESAGDGRWQVSFWEGGFHAYWDFAEDGQMEAATYYGEEMSTCYALRYAPGTGALESVDCYVGPYDETHFDGEGRLVEMQSSDALGSFSWTAEEGWACDADPEALNLPDLSGMPCPIDLNAPAREAGWYSL